MEKSFLKWMGGKGRVMPELLKYLPKGKRLIEPFVGAGNVFINTNYSSYVINDINKDLTNTYIEIKDNLQALLARMVYYRDTYPDYYKARRAFNEMEQGVDRSALFIHLNRRCFNGICRYNKSGEFNAPSGKYSNPYDPVHELKMFSLKLNATDTTITNQDFAIVIDEAEIGDVVYCDPPYLPFEENTTFKGYTKNDFGYAETLLLVENLKEAAKRGASVIMSNHDTPVIRSLLTNFTIHSINVQRCVSANSDRPKVSEIIATLNP